MLRKHIIRTYLADQEVYDVIGHDTLVYLKIAGGYLFFLGLLYLLFIVLQRYVINHQYVLWITALFGVMLYCKGLYDLADEYLDSLVITNRGLVLFRRNGLFNYKTNHLQWVSIESLSEAQNTFRDTLFKKGDITIRLEDEKITFREVGHPSDQVGKLLNRKEKILGRYQYHENETTKEVARDKYELLVEALGEVVTEYVDKKKETY